LGSRIVSFRIVKAAGTTGSTSVLPHGTAVTYSPAGRRLRERDRHGHDLARFTWREDDTLAEASVRIPDGSWLTIEPRATTDAPWGPSDRLWYRGAALTVFAAVDYARVSSIPPLAEPARLPPGGGTAMLNLIASLAADQGCRRLFYAGPYPTEQLFLALLESFRYDGGGDDPLRAFMSADLAWIPAPHERRVAEGGIWIQMRDEIEKVVWEGRAYYREVWQGVRRHAARRVRESEGRVLCSLWALGTGLEDHLRMGSAGEAIEVLPLTPVAPRVVLAPSAVLSGVAAAVAARSAPALGPFVMEVAGELTLEWGPVGRDLIDIDGARLRVTSRLLPEVRARLSAAPTSDESVNIALAVVAELAHLAGDALRVCAQVRLAALPPAAQAAVLEAARGVETEDCARAIATAVRALLADPALLVGADSDPPLRDGVQDQLDVEGDEGADRDR
jgi:hypothetical protein